MDWGKPQYPSKRRHEEELRDDNKRGRDWLPVWVPRFKFRNAGEYVEPPRPSWLDDINVEQFGPREQPYGPQNWQANNPWRQRKPTGASADVELKYSDQTKSFATMATAGAVEDSINHITQGTTEIRRIGRSVVMKKIMWRYTLTLPQKVTSARLRRLLAILIARGITLPPQVTTGTDVNPGDVCRVILFLDKQANGAAAAVTDILEGSAGQDWQSFNNLNNKDRFHILYDQTHALNYQAGIKTQGDVEVQPECSWNFSMYRDVNTLIQYSGTTGTIANIASNNYGFLIISKNAIAGMESEIRTRWTD